MGPQPVEMELQRERMEGGAGRRPWSCLVVTGSEQVALSRLDGLGVGQRPGPSPEGSPAWGSS